jgi:hypothetical protein
MVKVKIPITIHKERGDGMLRFHLYFDIREKWDGRLSAARVNLKRVRKYGLLIGG